MNLKRFLTASALALSFVVAAPSVAKADPISAAIVTFVGFTGTAATVATFVINSALYAAGSWAVGKAAQALGLVKNAVADRQASVTSLSLGETPRELIVGMACTGGSLADAFHFGGKYGTDTTTRCILLADHVLDGLAGYYVDDQYYPFVVDGVQPGFNGKLSIHFRNASPNGWSPPQHVRLNGGWTEADRLTGIAHVWVDTRVDDQVWTQGHPRLRFVVRGLRAYDPRKDAALGYTGPNPHVWADPATHEFTRNAEVLRYNFQRGIFAAGRHGQPEHLMFGRGLSAEEAPPARSIAAANLCDEQVDGEARYCADGVISAAQTFIEVEEMFAAAMAGVIVQREGGVAVEPGHAKAAVFTITDDDLVVGEPVSFSEFLPDTDGGRVNTVFSRYVEPAQGWKDHGSPPRREQADILEDGGPRETTLPLMLVISGKQADRCAEIARRRGRLERRASIVLPAEFSEIEEGDWIAWRSDRRHGGATVRYQVTSYSLDAKWRHRLSLEEIASSVYGVPDPVDDRAERPEPPVAVDALQLFGVTAEAIALSAPLPELEEGGEGAPGGPDPDEESPVTSTVPAVRFRWDLTDPIDAAVLAIRAEVRVQGTDQVTPTRTENVGLGVLVTTNGVGPHQTLEARLVPIGEPWRPVLPSPWLIVKTGKLIADDLSQEARDKLVDDVIKDVGDDIGEGTFNILSTIFNLFSTGSGAQTSYIDGVWYVLDPVLGTRSMWGLPFGGDNKLQWWTGPNSVPLGGETKANGYVFISMTTPRFGGLDVPINGFHAQADFAVRVGTRTTAGLVTTSAVTIDTSGATGTVSYAWSQIGGNDEWTIVTPSGATTTFRVNVATPGEIKRATFACVVTDAGSGKSFTIIVGGAAIYNI